MKQRYIQLSEFSKLYGIDYRKVRGMVNGEGVKILTDDDKVIQAATTVEKILTKLDIGEAKDLSPAYITGYDVQELRTIAKDQERIRRDLTGRLEVLQQENEVLQQKCEALQIDWKALLKNNEMLQQKQEVLQRDHEALQEVLQQKQEVLQRDGEVLQEALQKKMEALQKKMEALQKKYEVLQGRNEALQARYKKAQQQKGVWEVSLYEIGSYICMAITVFSIFRVFGVGLSGIGSFGIDEWYSIFFAICFSALFVVIGLANMRVLRAGRKGIAWIAIGLQLMYSFAEGFIHYKSFGKSFDTGILGTGNWVNGGFAFLLAVTLLAAILVQKKQKQVEVLPFLPVPDPINQF